MSKITSNDFVLVSPSTKERAVLASAATPPFGIFSHLEHASLTCFHRHIVSPVASTQRQTCSYSLDSLDSPLLCMLHFPCRASACLTESASPKMHSVLLKPWEAGSGRIWQNTSTVNYMQLITARFASEIDFLEANPQARDHPVI